MNKENLIEIRKNIFLDRSDPRFHEKYMRYHRTDSNALYTYAKKLEQAGDMERAVQGYFRAAERGHTAAKEKLRRFGMRNRPSRNRMLKKQPRHLPWLLLIILLLIIALLVCLLLNHHLLESNWFHTENHYVRNSEQIYEVSSDKAALSDGGPSPLSPKQVRNLAVINALRRYKQINGVYPKTLHALMQPSPKNYLDNLPSGLTYQRTPHGYSLRSEGGGAFTAQRGRFVLDFYPQSNKLALFNGPALLAVYPVASGKSPLPFTAATILRKVVDPNGGSGALGTRGMTLRDGYAIHGTNKPSLIGQYVTHGCLRMKNADIEALYPYVSIGTPVKVISGPFSRTKPIFSSGLPVMHISEVQLSKEKTPHTVYHWRG